MKIGRFYGKLTNTLIDHSGWPFITKDHDYDKSNSGNCAKKFGSGWWFHKNPVCGRVNLNGRNIPFNKVTLNHASNKAMVWDRQIYDERLIYNNGLKSYSINIYDEGLMLNSIKMSIRPQ